MWIYNNNVRVMTIKTGLFSIKFYSNEIVAFKTIHLKIHNRET